jgi:hypothetical protein
MIVFWLATLGAVIGVSIVHIYGNLRQIEAEWSQYRCIPPYMFLAGYMDPQTGLSGNFQNCMNLIGKPIVSSMIDALGSQFSIISDALSGIVNPLALMRKMMNTIRKFIGTFASSTLGKVSGPMSMFVYYLNKIQDIMRRITAEGYVAAFFGVSAVSFMEGFISLLFGVIKVFVAAMLLIAIVLSISNLPFLVAIISLASALVAAGA